jgi:hypothetical protein
MPRSAIVVSDEARVLRLITSRYGNALPQNRLDTVLQRNPQLDSLDWSLLVLCIEIELHVSMTPRLLEIGRWTVGSFARAVAALPKQASVTYTLDRLTLLVDELLGAQAKSEASQKRRKKAQVDSASTKGLSSRSPRSGNRAPPRPTPSARRG